MADELDVGLGALRALLVEASERQKKPAGKEFSNIEAGVEYAGKKITLPDDPRKMRLAEAREWLIRLEAQEETVVALFEPIKNVHPFDGAVAFMRALKEIYGWASPVPTPTFFGPQPPQTISIDTGHDENAVIFWGSFQIPGIEGRLQTHVHEERGKRPVFAIIGNLKKKFVEPVHVIAELTRKIVAEQSIYRGKALRLELANDEIDYSSPPTFINLKRIKENELVFSEDVMADITTNLWTPIEHTQRCRDEGVPLKRGVLLEGPYGTGKTLAASITAKRCDANGWTFITVPRAAALEPALHFAASYQPCVLFVEDIDRELEGRRTAEMDDILNTIDGIVSKGAEIMVVLTSNHAELINQAMIRPGRLDAVIHIGAPDAAAVQKLLRVYGRKLIKKDADLSEAGEALAGRIPAVIREAVERSKLYAISNRPGEDFFLTGADIARAARGMEAHMRLLEGNKATRESDGEIMAKAMKRALGLDGGDEATEELGNDVDAMHGNLLGRINKLQRTMDEIRANQD